MACALLKGQSSAELGVSSPRPCAREGLDRPAEALQRLDRRAGGVMPLQLANDLILVLEREQPPRQRGPLRQVQRHRPLRLGLLLQLLFGEQPRRVTTRHDVILAPRPIKMTPLPGVEYEAVDGDEHRPCKVLA
eukprot:CAMPEP_0119514544 /NCGR_PEP_ID=MMETSP1344-20130328/32344_1 /TAXON_ID=236787 /ORGANISM="Florenciella parvula, Strain CCMP2471" /LENGTH=133 /DNA_ID=CAMNT_0007551873 /DNA_START=54 /DNA_END=451 /DNA_ORIENTATION=+